MMKVHHDKQLPKTPGEIPDFKSTAKTMQSSWF